MSDAGAKIVAFIREVYRTDAFVPLHAPIFKGNEKQYLSNCIDTTFVSYVGEYVNAFEQKIAAFTGAKYAVAVVNGTCALHIALLMADVKPEDEVITQALTFVATANAIAYTGATPTFVDVDKDTMGMSPEALNGFLQQHCTKKADGYTYNNRSGRRIKACVPMHTFGFPARIQQIKDICDAYQITLVEDSAESLGSYTEGQHTGLWGASSILSFNGNKTITCGGGGALITNDAALAQRAKHITTTAKVPHKWEFYHDALGYNYRLSNVHAAIGCAQMEQLPQILESKRKVAMQYAAFFKDLGITFVGEREGTTANFWLNTILLEDKAQRDQLLEYTNSNQVMTRPIWQLMNELPMYKHCISDGLAHSKWLADRIINLPSSALIN